ncbi:Fis family transcriptional regulator [Paenibacillus sp. BIHB 4019]|uniref:Fis family transcriptional regulator n=1 Tax=Paenibacillus sp. BIHB 4019 TaxID=1870819 RepID=A0A1B2DHD7_9BACL|nr:UvrD-helicase domain-containing protein [Paenibacillus sp. BIHB 4019]ANY67113.1 Fis family transcriptional regulator [Paenibacillus sp. BIHB 4019]
MSIVDKNNVDDYVDDEICSCMNLDRPKSFFLFAGAGSGKTKSLVTSLNRFQEKNFNRMKLSGQRIAIITFTNVASEEIERRLDYNPLFIVSTIHSFIWELIKDHQLDIKKWLHDNLKIQIEELQEKQRKGSKGTKTANDRISNIEYKTKRIQKLNSITKFSYSPNGENKGVDSLNHSEVINIGVYFLTQKPLLQKILIRKFPFLLIDESQDTNTKLMDAFFKVQSDYSSEFALGLFGDTMQRIYLDGKADLGMNLPTDWAKPIKKMNHRSPNRIIKLINKIRSVVDDQEQLPRTDAREGCVRLFIFPNEIDKKTAENKVVKQMFEITKDLSWGENSDYISLILEHHMAASRIGFENIFSALNPVDKLKTGLWEGSLPELKFFTQIILPIAIARDNNDQFIITSIVKKYSPLLIKKTMRSSTNQLKQLKLANAAMKKLLSLWDDRKEPTGNDILQCVAQSKLFDIPGSLTPLIIPETIQKCNETNESVSNSEKGAGDPELDAWRLCLSSNFSQFKAYESYISEQTNFRTHQGVKGLEFPNVMVIIDDHDSRGKTFNYEKLFGAKERTVDEIKNEKEGRDSSISRTRRLFYVTCSRAEKSLAIVAYTAEPEKVKKHVLQEGWFGEDEIEIL